MTTRTQRNLSIGMHAEAFASAKYKRFAAFARTRQNPKLAALLTEAADESRIGHFARELEMEGLISDDLGNLQDAIRDTLYDAERYKQFAQEAAQDRDGNAAALFQALATDGEHRVTTLESALAQNQKPTT